MAARTVAILAVGVGMSIFLNDHVLKLPAVAAVATQASDDLVVHRPDRKTSRALVFVAVRAIAAAGRWDVTGRWFAQRLRAVMAACASRRDACVIECGTEECGRTLVASFAGCGCRNVHRRFAGRERAIMAGRAAGRDGRVLVNKRAKERRCALVAGLASERSWNVCGWRLAKRSCTIVT